MRKDVFISLFASAAILASCASGEKGPALCAGSVWQNGTEIYIAEDSTSYWQLYGGTLHEGGFEMKLAKDGKWLVPTIVDNRPTDSVAGTWQLDADTIRLTARDKTVRRLCVVGRLSVHSRSDIPAKVLPALDSVQQMSVFRSLEGTYRDGDGKRWTFSANTMQRMGLGTKEKYAVGKSLDMNDSVIFSDNVAFAYSLTRQGIDLYKAEYVDSASVWKYDKKKKPVVVLKRQ